MGSPLNSGWPIVFDPEFEEEYGHFPVAAKKAILKKLALVRQYGPGLGRPHADTLAGSSLANLQELVVQVGGEPWRILYAFNKDRSAVLLGGGNKGGENERRWYNDQIGVAIRRAKTHRF